MTISVNYLSAIKARKLGTIHTKHETYWNEKKKRKECKSVKRKKKVVVFFSFFYFISFPLRHRTCSLSSLVVVVVVAFVTFKRFPLSKRNLLEWIASHPDSLRERRINSESFSFFFFFQSHVRENVQNGNFSTACFVVAALLRENFFFPYTEKKYKFVHKSWVDAQIHPHIHSKKKEVIWHNHTISLSLLMYLCFFSRNFTIFH